MEKDILYKNIHDIRVENNLTQEQVAEALGYSSNAMIARIERGDMDLNYSKIKKFADYLNISVPKLLGFNDEHDVLDRINKLKPEWKEYVLQQIDYAVYKNETT